MGCGKMKAGGPVKKVKKMALGGSATNKLNNPRPATKPQRGGSNVKMKIYGVPNAGPTGPNIQGVNTMKKGGAIKMQNGGTSDFDYLGGKVPPVDSKMIRAKKQDERQESNARLKKLRKSGVVTPVEALKLRIAHNKNKKQGVPSLKKGMKTGGSTKKK